MLLFFYIFSNVAIVLAILLFLFFSKVVIFCCCQAKGVDVAAFIEKEEEAEERFQAGGQYSQLENCQHLTIFATTKLILFATTNVL